MASDHRYFISNVNCNFGSQRWMQILLVNKLKFSDLLKFAWICAMTDTSFECCSFGSLFYYYKFCCWFFFLFIILLFNPIELADAKQKESYKSLHNFGSYSLANEFDENQKFQP